MNKLNKKYLFVDATPLNFGGGGIVLDNFISGFIKSDSNYQNEVSLFIYCHPFYTPKHRSSNLKFFKLPKSCFFLHVFLRIYLMAIGFFIHKLILFLLKRESGFLSLSNIPANMFSIFPQVTFLHQAHLTEAGKLWRRDNRALIGFNNRVKFNFMTRVVWFMQFYQKVWFVVQTNFMSKEVKKIFKQSADRILIVKQGIELLSPVETSSLDSKNFRLFCLTRGYPHKRLEVLQNICKFINDNFLPIKVITTLGNNSYENLIKLKLSPYAGVWENLGPLSHAEAMLVLGSCNALLWTSQLESLGLPILESLMLGRPVVTLFPNETSKEILGELEILLDSGNLTQKSLENICQKLDFTLNNATMRQSLNKLALKFVSDSLYFYNSFYEVVFAK